MSEISKTIVRFVKTRENLKVGFEIILKIDQINAFLLFPKEHFENFLKAFPNYCFSSKARKINAGVFIFLKKSPKIIHFLQFS